MRDDRERLEDVVTAIDRILEKTALGRPAFERDEMLQVWVLHHLQIVGEAARALSPEFRQKHTDKVWSKAIGLRNVLVHHYFEIKPDQVWKVVEEELPSLRQKVAFTISSEWPPA